MAHDTELTIIRIRLLRHKTTGMLVTKSDDLPGLVIFGHDEDVIEEKIPGAIADLYLADGIKVLSLTAERDDVPDFAPAAFIASAALAEATA